MFGIPLLIAISTHVFASFTSWGNQKIYSKLNKLYLTDRNKCMEVSKKLIAKKPTTSIPYYFTSVIYYDKSKESQTLKGVYLQLYRSVSNAAKFEKLSSEGERSLVNWDEHLVSLKNRAIRLASSLKKNEMDDLSTSLLAGLNKIESVAAENEVAKEDVLNDADLAQFESTTTKTESVVNEASVPTHLFFGMPSGNENVRSANTTEEQNLLALINAERAKKGAQPLTWSEDLARACRYHAYDLGSQGYFSHDSYDVSNGKKTMVGTTFNRIEKFSKRAVDGECIAAGGNTAEKTFIQWMESPGHRKIIMDASSKTVGIGYQAVENSPFVDYWVLATGK